MSMNPKDFSKSNEVDPAFVEILATAFLQALFKFLRLTETHKRDNRIFEEAMPEILRTFQSFVEGQSQTFIELTFRGEQIFINKIRLRPRPRQFHVYRFILKFMRVRRLGMVVIRKGDTPKDLADFFWLLSESRDFPRDKIEPAIQLNNLLKEKGLSGFFEVRPLNRMYLGTGAGGEGGGEGDGLQDVELAAAAVYEGLHKFVATILDNLENAARFELKNLKTLISDLMLLAEEDIVQMLRLVSVKRYDRPLPYRAVNACFLMTAWAYSLRLPKGVAAELAELALAHPLTLLATDGRCRPLENSELPKLMASLARIREVWPLNELQVLSLSDWTIPFGKDGVYSIGDTKCYQHFFARMLRVVARFEEMTTYEKGQRVYLPDEALAQMLKSPEDCDPTLLKIFINWLGVYPVGSLVELNTGEIAQVFAGASDPMKFQRPLVLIVKTSDGRVLDRPEVFDLSEMNEKLGTYRKSIRKSTTFEAAGIDPEKLNASPIAF